MARGEGAQSSVTEQKAAVQLGLRDEQCISIMATHLLRLLARSVHCAMSHSLEEGGRDGSLRSMGHQTCISQVKGSLLLGEEKLLPDEREIKYTQGGP